MFDLANLTASDLVVCGSDLRQATAAATTPEEAARALARHLRGAFADPASGVRQLSLVRVYATAVPEGAGPCDRVLELLAGDAESEPLPGHPGRPDLIPLGGGRAPVQLHPALDAVLRDLGVVGEGTPRGGVPIMRPTASHSEPPEPPDSPGSAGHPGPPGLPAGQALSQPTPHGAAPPDHAHTIVIPAPPAPAPVPAAASREAGSAPETVRVTVRETVAETIVEEVPDTVPRVAVGAAADGRSDPRLAVDAYPNPYPEAAPRAEPDAAPPDVSQPDPLDAYAERHAIAHIPDQMAALHGTRTVLGYAGTLPDGELFTVLLYSGHHIPPAAAEALRGLTAATRLALLPAPPTPVPTPRNGQMTAARLDALEQLLAATEDTTVEQARTVETYRGRVRTQAEQLRIKQRRLEQETHIVETLYSVGQQLTRELDLDHLVQTATDAATTVIAAEHGILLYRDCDTDDGLDAIRHAAAARTDSPHPLLPDPDVRLTAAHLAEDVVRSGDVAEHPGRWHSAPVAVDPEALPVRSYLGVPVVSREGQGLGAFAFSHSKPDIFTERDEQLALGIASQAAAAIENARLYRSVRDTAVRLQRSLLPAELPDIEALEIACRYLPGARGSQVGGDWFDVIPLSAGRVALVIGDVMGRGLAAAAVMGQLRTAVRAYAVMDLPPAQVMRHLNRLMSGMGSEDQITTCVYAVYDPWHDSVRWSNAGHLPPALISADGGVRLLDDDLGVPLGVEGTTFEDADVVFRACDRLLLYTDGLVERHDTSLTDRLQLFTSEVGGAARNPDGVQDTCDRLMGGMLTGREHDDVALLLVRAREGRERAAALELPPTAKAAREARAFARSVLTQWRLPGLGDAACSVVTELVVNAVEHARTPMELRLGHRPGRLVVQVADHDGRLPRRLVASEGDERHRGLTIVAALSADWGVRPTDTGKVVWAELVEPV